MKEQGYIPKMLEKSRFDRRQHRIPRSRRYHGEEWRGYQSSKRRYFYGLKLRLMVSGKGQPVQFFLTPASWSDTRALKMYQFDSPDEALITGDKAYNNYHLEDLILEANLNLLPLRKENFHRSLPSWMAYLWPVAAKVLRPLTV